MFDIGFSELLLIGIVALLVLGPERLPKAARTVGALLRKARSSFDSVRQEVEREIRDEELKRTLKEFQRPEEMVREVMAPLEQEAREVSNAVRKADEQGLR